MHTEYYYDKMTNTIYESYDKPYSYEEIVKNYGKKTADKLMQDPAHKYRASTGIELIHKEPSKTELDRIYRNWQQMDDDMKSKSDRKSMQLFGMTNENHYKKLINEYK